MEGDYIIIRIKDTTGGIPKDIEEPLYGSSSYFLLIIFTEALAPILEAPAFTILIASS